MTNILARVGLAGAIACGLAQTSPAQVLLKNTSFEDHPLLIAPWELVNDSNLENPRLTTHARYGNYFTATRRFATNGPAGVRQAFSIGGTAGVVCAFSAYWRAPYPGSAPDLRLQITRKSDNGVVAEQRFSVGASAAGIWQPVGYRLSVPPGSYWASAVFESVYSGVWFELDEIVLRQATLPVVSPTGRHPTQCYFWVTSSDERVWHLLLVALQRLDTPIPVPGIRGVLELDPFRDGGLLIWGVGLGSREWILPYAPIASLDRTIFLQALDFNPILSVMQFGSRTGVLYYK